MRAVIQRVSAASVTIAGQATAAIGSGLLVLLGIETADTPEDTEWLSQDLGKPVLTGEFGADMKIALVNDGPVTILIDTKARE